MMYTGYFNIVGAKIFTNNYFVCLGRKEVKDLTFVF